MSEEHNKRLCQDKAIRLRQRFEIAEQNSGKRLGHSPKILPLFLFGLIQLVIRGSSEPSLFVSTVRSYAIMELDSLILAASKRHAAKESLRFDLSTRQSRHNLSKYTQARASVLISILARTQATSACCLRLWRLQRLSDQKWSSAQAFSDIVVHTFVSWKA